MSKQDRTYTRTAADLERKFAFGQTFAEVYDLVADAQKAANEANAAVDKLDKTLTSEQIFNRLTNYGKLQGVFRNESDHIYINASYIKGEVLEGDGLKVAAANITGKLTADKIDAKNLSVDAANITGELKTGVLQASLNVLANAVEAGAITAGSIDGSFLAVNAATVKGVFDAEYADISNLTVSAAKIEGTLDATNVDISGKLAFGYMKGTTFEKTAYMGVGFGLSASGEDTYGALLAAASKDAYTSGDCYVIVTNGGVRLQAGTHRVVVTPNSVTIDGNAVGQAVFG